MPPLTPPSHLMIDLSHIVIERASRQAASVTLHAHGRIDCVWAVSADLHGAVFRVALGPCYLRRSP